MPTTKTEDLPGTIQRSPEKAQRTYAETLDAAHDQYPGDEERAHRTAFASLKHSFEKVGDHWEPKDEKGPSDARAAAGRNSNRRSRGGVNATATKAHLMDVAKKLDITGRSRMKKGELVDAIEKANDRQTAKARES